MLILGEFMLKAFKKLTAVELIIWVSSLFLIVASFVLCQRNDIWVMSACLIGATALIFLAKGEPLGQILIIIFALLYGYISLRCRYYGEMITYIGMTLPMAAAALISWLKNPYEKGEGEVKIAHVTKKSAVMLWIFAAVTTAVLGYLLYILKTPNLSFSILSVTTSFVAAGYTILRSPYYAIGYAANDVVLIVLWVLMSRNDPSLIPMVTCFVIFLVNDSYGFINWKRMRKRQESK